MRFCGYEVVRRFVKADCCFRATAKLYNQKPKLKPKLKLKLKPKTDTDNQQPQKA